MGAGAIGSNVGGSLAEAGHDVLLVDQWPEHVDAINAKGLRLRYHSENRTIAVPAIHLHQAQAIRQPFDTVLLAVKSYDTEWATTFALGFLAKPDGFFVSFQNGINEPAIAAIAGAQRTVGCVVTISAALVGPAHAIRADAVTGSNNVQFAIGELNGAASDRARDLTYIIDAVGPAKLTTNLIGLRWSKLAANCMLNGLAALTGFDSGDILVDDTTRLIAIQLAAEAIAVAKQAGHQVEPIVTIDPARYLDAAVGGGEQEAVNAELRRIGVVVGKTGGQPSTLQDVLKGRRTEIPHLNGIVVRQGIELGVPTPVNQALVEQFERFGPGFTPAAANVEPLAGIVEALAAA